MKYKFRRRLLYVFLRFIGAVLFLLPIRFSVYLGGYLGILVFFLARHQRLKTLENIRFAFGNQKSSKEIFNIAKDVFKNFGKDAAELINFPKINSHNIDTFIGVYGIQKV